MLDISILTKKRYKINSFDKKFDFHRKFIKSKPYSFRKLSPHPQGNDFLDNLEGGLWALPTPARK